MPTEVIEIEQEVGTVIEETIIEILEIGETGLAGPPGPSVTTFEQSFSAAIQWTVNHNLGRYPIISVLSVGNVEIIADIVHTSINQFIVYFASLTAGRVRCI